MKRKNDALSLVAIFLLAGISLSAHAQDVPRVIQQQATGKSAAEIAKELANPNTPLASLNMKNQFRWFDGTLPNAGDQFSYTMLFQPTFPFPVDDQGSVVFFRPAIPLLIDNPVFTPQKLDFDNESGLGDIAFDLAYGRTTESGFLWAFGMVSTLPTATSGGLSGGRWTLGPEVLLGKLTDTYVVGIFPSHQWDVAGWTDNEVNLTTIQAFLTWLPGGGWNVGSAPIMTYNWQTEEWTIPLQLQVGKTVIVGQTPWKFSVEANYYVDRPDAFGSEWMIGFNVSPVVENIFASWLGLGSTSDR